jgi:predicted heme/steroid binding protein
MKDLSAEELATFDGRDGRPIYVAYEGMVYDLSDSPMWTGGDHEGMHSAGHDLTADQDDAPHDVHVTDFPQVGRLV